MWNQMGFAARAVVIIMFLMSAWSIGVMIDRWLAYSAAKKQSRQFAPAVAGALAPRASWTKRSSWPSATRRAILAKVVVAGLQEFQAHELSTEIPGETIESSKRALWSARRPSCMAELKKGLSGLGDDRVDGRRSLVCSAPWSASSTRSRASRKRSRPVWARSRAVSRRRWSPPLSACSWRFRPCGCSTTSTGRSRAFDVEMDNSSSELIDYFLKRSHQAAAQVGLPA